MRPVHEPALRVPDVFAFEFDLIPGAEVRDTRRDVDVVRDEDRLPRRKADEESLMPAPSCVVGEYARHDAGAVDANILRVTRERT